MNLYRVHFKHYAPKDSKGGILGIIAAEDEDTVFDVLAPLAYWDDTYSDDPEEWEVKRGELPADIGAFNVTVEDDGDPHWEWVTVRGMSTDLVRALRGDRGEEVQDTYYGFTHRWWVDLGPATDAEVATLRRLGLLIGEQTP